MGRANRGKKPKKRVDDNEEHEIGDEPNPESEDFFQDDVDKFHSNREKILLDTEPDRVGRDSDSDEDNEEEVMGLDLAESDDEEEDDDDVEEEEEDEEDSEDEEDGNDGLPSDKAWGKKKLAYYDADVVDADIGSDEEAWALEEEEEQEALVLQKRLASTLDEQDFDIAEFETTLIDEDKEDDSDIDKVQMAVVMDLSKLSKEQKLEILFRDSPELFELLDEFKKKLKEIVSRLNPLVQMAKEGKIPAEGATYVELKHKLYLNYCINIGFYLLLKARQAPVKEHPVIGRIVQYRMLIKELEPLDSRLESDIDFLLAHKDDMPVRDEEKTTRDVESKKVKKRTKVRQGKMVKKNEKPEQILSSLLDDSNDDNKIIIQSQAEKKTRKHKRKDQVDPLAYYEEVRLRKKIAKEMKETAVRLAHEHVYDEDVYGGEEGKRAISRQISKNKGLTARKKKQERNPRVKHRKKYIKALIKRKSQVRPVVNEDTRYGGEKTGIRAFLTRSVKIK